MPEAKYRKVESPRFRQGDIVRDVVVTLGTDLEEEQVVSRVREVPYCVVVSQDCDLEHDFNFRADEQRKNNDKFLPTILISPAYPAQTFRTGDHLAEQQLKMTAFHTGDWERLKKNHLYRYHYLPPYQDLQVPELVVDFKHFFAVPRDIFYSEFKQKYVAGLDDLFREDFSNRFAYYLSRIGLPEPV
jgi:hypothetical protein